MDVKMQLIILAGVFMTIRNTPTIMSIEETTATLLEGSQEIKFITEKQSIILSAIELRKEINRKMINMTNGNQTTIEKQIVENYIPFLKHTLFECTMKIHEINLLDNFIHLLTTTYEANLVQFAEIPFNQADAKKSNQTIESSIVNLDSLVLELITKMKSTPTTAIESYNLEISLFASTLKKILNTNDNTLTIFCTHNTQQVTYYRILGEHLKEDETIETLQQKLKEVKNNFVDRIKIFFPEILYDKQNSSRDKRGLWGSWWGTILSLATTDEVDNIKHSQEVLLLNERQISQKFAQFDKTSQLIAKELQISEDNFKKIKENEDRLGEFMFKEEMISLSMRKKFAKGLQLTHLSLDNIYDLMMYNYKLSNIDMKIADLRKVVNQILGVPDFSMIPVTKINPSVFQQPGFIGKNPTKVSSNLTHWTIELNIPYVTPIRCLKIKTIPILAGNNTYTLLTPTAILIYKNYTAIVQECGEHRNIEFSTPNSCTKAIINNLQSNITTQCPASPVNLERPQYSLIRDNRITILSTNPDKLTTTCLKYSNVSDLKQGYTEFTPQSTCEYRTNNLFIPPQYPTIKIEKNDHFDNEFFKESNLIFPTLDFKVLPPVSTMVLATGDVNQLKYVLENANQGNMVLGTFDMSNTIHANVLIINIIITIIIIISIAIVVCKIKNWCKERRPKYTNTFVRYSDVQPEEEAWVVIKGDRGEHLLLDQDNKMIFHPITNTILNLDTFTPLKEAKMPPRELLQEYQQLIKKQAKNIYRDEKGVFRLKDSQIYFKDGDWRFGNDKLLGFPSPQLLK